jgi:hypothetical protein
MFLLKQLLNINPQAALRNKIVDALASVVSVGHHGLRCGTHV